MTMGTYLNIRTTKILNIRKEISCN